MRKDCYSIRFPPKKSFLGNISFYMNIANGFFKTDVRPILSPSPSLPYYHDRREEGDGGE